MPIIETKDTGSCKKTITIEVPSDKIKEQVEVVYQELLEKAEVPGFRRGHVPLSVLQMRFGRAVEGESRLKAAEGALADAVKELNIQMVGEPDIHDLEGEGEEPIKFQVDIQYYPTIELKEYRGVPVQVLQRVVADSDVQEALEEVREQHAFLVPVEGRPAGEGDIVTLDCVATVDGEDFPEAKMEAHRFRIGGGKHLPGFEECLVGKNPGDSVEADIQLPETLSIEKHRGKTAHFVIDVKNVSEWKLPELDDEFAKDSRADSLDQLKQRIRQSLETRVETEKPRMIRRAYEEKLLEAHAFDVPSVLVEGEEAYVASLHESHLAKLGINVAELTDEQKAATDAVNREAAVRNVKLSLLLRKIGEEEGVTVNDDELEDFIEDAAKRDGEDPARFRIFVDNRKLEPYFRREAMEKKVMELMLQTLKVEWVESLPEKETGEAKAE